MSPARTGWEDTELALDSAHMPPRNLGNCFDDWPIPAPGVAFNLHGSTRKASNEAEPSSPAQLLVEAHVAHVDAVRSLAYALGAADERRRARWAPIYWLGLGFALTTSLIWVALGAPQ